MSTFCSGLSGCTAEKGKSFEEAGSVNLATMGTKCKKMLLSFVNVVVLIRLVLIVASDIFDMARTDQFDSNLDNKKKPVAL